MKDRNVVMETDIEGAYRHILTAFNNEEKCHGNR